MGRARSLTQGECCWRTEANSTYGDGAALSKVQESFVDSASHRSPSLDEMSHPALVERGNGGGLRVSTVATGSVQH
jgi:hypothetical protein